MPLILTVASLDGSLDACVNNGNVSLLICEHESVNIKVKSGLYLLDVYQLLLNSTVFLYNKYCALISDKPVRVKLTKHLPCVVMIECHTCICVGEHFQGRMPMC